MPAPLPVKRDAEATRTKPESQANSSAEAPASSDIAGLAYALWKERGCPYGSAETDWLEAERKLRESSVHAAPEMIRG